MPNTAVSSTCRSFRAFQNHLLDQKVEAKDGVDRHGLEARAARGAGENFVHLKGLAFSKLVLLRVGSGNQFVEAMLQPLLAGKVVERVLDLATKPTATWPASGWSWRRRCSASRTSNGGWPSGCYPRW